MTTIQTLTPETHPALFARIHQAGLILGSATARGETRLLDADRLKICVTGARACTSYGAQVTSDIVEGAIPGRVLVTGGAYGVDTEAMRAVLRDGHPVIFVTAGGPDCLYPAGNAALHQRILDTGGLILSAQPAGTLPTRLRHLGRLELMAAISDIVVIIEAGTRSGSMHLAHTAQRMGRPLGAIPGPATSAASAGTNNLIRNGARLITTADDICTLTPR